MRGGQSRLTSRYVLVLPLGQTGSEPLSQQSLARWRIKSGPGASGWRSDRRTEGRGLVKKNQQENRTGEDRSTRVPSCRGTNQTGNPLPPHFKCIFSITFMAPGGKIKFYDAPQRHSRVFAPLQRKFRDNDVPAQRVKNEG